MKLMIQVTRATLRLSVVALGLIWFAVASMTQAVVPTPDGGYPGGNTAEGQAALFSLTSGTFNTAVGLFSLRSNTEGQFNTAIGAAALLDNIGGQGGLQGSQNTAVGAAALLNNTQGDSNTANGAFALFSNTTGRHNTAVGSAALLDNSTGVGNTAMGDVALVNNTTGRDNTATGLSALSSNTEGSENTATGSFALERNTTGIQNTAIGSDVLEFNTTGSNNAATGFQALSRNTTGFLNTADGWDALFLNTTGHHNTAIGDSALANNTSGSVNVAVGDFAGGNLTTGNSNIEIGNPGVAAESDTIRIGLGQAQTFIAGIFGATSAGGAAVLVNSDGKLGTSLCSARFKDQIRPMSKASEALFALKPVTFRYKKEIDPHGRSQFGLVAEDVEKVHPDLVVRDKAGKPYSVRYDQVNAMLLNEFLKEHRKNEQQEATIEQLKSIVQKHDAANAEQQKQIEALAAGLQKVSDEIELSKPAPHTVLNSP